MTTTDTPESVAARLNSFAEIWSAGFPDETQHLEALQTGAATLRAQAAEIARLSKRLEEMERVRSCAVADHVAAEAALADARTKFGRAGAIWQKARMRLEVERDEARAALAASEAKGQAMREALKNVSRFVRAFAADETDEEIHASACACEEQIGAALSTPPAEQPGPADAPSLLAAWWLDGASFDQRLLAAGLVKAIAYDLTEAGEAAINHHVATRSAGLLPATEGEGR